MYTYIIIKCIGGSRHFERGREEDGVSPRRHLSQMHTTNHMPFTREKAAYLKFFEANRGDPPWIRHRPPLVSAPPHWSRPAGSVRTSAGNVAVQRRQPAAQKLPKQFRHHPSTTSCGVFLDLTATSRAVRPLAARWRRFLRRGRRYATDYKAQHTTTKHLSAVWQLQPKSVQTVQQHCLVWIYLDT